MARFQVDIEKSALGERWTNRYFVETSDITAATAAGNGLVAMEKSFHRNWVAFNTLRVRTTTVGDDIYTITPLTGTGAVSGAVAAALPLFNVLRIDLGATSGRPSRKYYRGVLEEADQAGGALDPAAYYNAVSGLKPSSGAAPWWTWDGQELITVAPHKMVVMRQLRRGSRRRTQPILTGG